MAFVPEGQADRSLARSAWKSATPKSRPVGYGMIRAGVRTDSMIEVAKLSKVKNVKKCMLSPSWPTIRISFHGKNEPVAPLLVGHVSI
jgi:hypothetical protein